MSAQLITIQNWLDFIIACPLLTCRLLRYGYTFRKIDLGESYFTIVEPRDYYQIRRFKWCVWGNGSKFYAVRIMVTGPGKTKVMYLHRQILNAPKGVLVDHRNRDPLDNRRENLRFATQSENMQNRGKRKNGTSKFIGVWFVKVKGKWESRITHKGKLIYIGSFDSEIAAAKAYDAAAKKYHGEFARLNFPEETTPSRAKRM
jgi:hypothetical protein